MTSKPLLAVPSTMGDDEQLLIRNLLTRGPLVQPNSLITTRLSNGSYHYMRYKDVEPMAQQLASSLSIHGISIGDCVGTLMYNNFHHLLLFYTCASMGAIINALNRSLHPNRLEYIINHSKVKCTYTNVKGVCKPLKMVKLPQNFLYLKMYNIKILFVDESLCPLLSSLNLSKLKYLTKIIVTGKDFNEKGLIQRISKLNLYGCTTFYTFLTNGNRKFKWPTNLSERNGVLICFTSGTTGYPKGVLYSHRSCYLHCLVWLSTDHVSLSGTDSALPLGPFFHAGGWMMPYVCFLLGFQINLNNETSEPIDLLNIMQIHKVTILLGVPTLLQSIKTIIENNPSKYGNIKHDLSRILTGGSACPPDLIDWYDKQIGAEIIHGWGLTETNPIGTIGRRISKRKDLELLKQGKYSELTKNQLSQGTPIPTVEMKIVDPNDFTKEKPMDNKNSSAGPSVTKSYFGVSTPEKFTKDGYLVTGDIGVFNNIAQLTIKDRSKDMIKSGGEWISSIDLENYIMGMSQVSKACVIGISHPKWMQRPIVIVELNEGKNLTLEEIRNYCSKNWKKWQLPVDLVFMQIPLTGSGKMSKKDVRIKLKEMNYILPEFRNKKSKL